MRAFDNVIGNKSKFGLLFELLNIGNHISSEIFLSKQIPC